MMDKVYTLRVMVQLFDQERGDWVENVIQVRTQELTGNLCELAMMLPAVRYVAEGMAMSAVGSEQRQHAQAQA